MDFPISIFAKPNPSELPPNPPLKSKSARQWAQTLLSGSIYGLTFIIGLIAFLYPFWFPEVAQLGASGPNPQARSGDSPLMLSVLVGVCFIALLLEVQGQAISAKLIALLGVLVAINAVLRFVEVAIPGPGGFSPVFFLILISGYVFGARFGFLMGALTLFVSAIITGGVGPWLPYQMFTAGWAGMSAGLGRPLVRWLKAEGHPLEVVALAAFGAWWGLVYGLIINIWFWPFATGPSTQYWQAGLGLAETLERYAAFYLATSLGWDLLRAFGNAALMAAFAWPTLRVLRRFQSRFEYTYLPQSD